MQPGSILVFTITVVVDTSAQVQLFQNLLTHKVKVSCRRAMKGRCGWGARRRESACRHWWGTAMKCFSRSSARHVYARVWCDTFVLRIVHHHGCFSVYEQ